MDVQTGPEGCILQCTIESKLEEVRKVSRGLSTSSCVCFGLGPVRRMLTNLLKILISLLRKINIRVIIYLDHVLILSQTIREARMSRDTVLYLLQNMSFIIDIKKSILHPCQKTEFVGMKIDSIKMTFSLTPDQKRYKTLSKLARTF